MSEPSRPRPVPGPPGGPTARTAPSGPGTGADAEPPATALCEPAPAQRLAGLDERPVAEHVDVFEAEHARLERDLRTIDRL